MKVRTKQHSSVVISSYWEPVANILLHLYFFCCLERSKIFMCGFNNQMHLHLCSCLWNSQKPSMGLADASTLMISIWRVVGKAKRPILELDASQLI